LYSRRHHVSDALIADSRPVRRRCSGMAP
jgi:hypothetical protein